MQCLTMFLVPNPLQSNMQLRSPENIAVLTVCWQTLVVSLDSEVPSSPCNRSHLALALTMQSRRLPHGCRL